MTFYIAFEVTDTISNFINATMLLSCYIFQWFFGNLLVFFQKTIACCQYFCKNQANPENMMEAYPFVRKFYMHGGAAVI